MNLLNNGDIIYAKGEDPDRLCAAIIEELDQTEKESIKLRIEVDLESVAKDLSSIPQLALVATFIRETESAMNIGRCSGYTDGKPAGSFSISSDFYLNSVKSSPSSLDAYILYDDKRDKVRYEFIASSMDIRSELHPLMSVLATSVCVAYARLKLKCHAAITLTCAKAYVTNTNGGVR